VRANLKALAPPASSRGAIADAAAATATARGTTMGAATGTTSGTSGGGGSGGSSNGGEGDMALDSEELLRLALPLALVQVLARPSFVLVSFFFI
jgi:hypothetical protein